MINDLIRLINFGVIKIEDIKIESVKIEVKNKLDKRKLTE